jgi:2-polyprenyl-6-methoxyphenol hydroxylase-like FAD-dependent oxidoreductase
MERTSAAASAPSRFTPLGDTAVVIGGSLAGLLAARVLTGYFRQVTIIERDALPDAIAPHKGVPQGRHAHGLLGMGQQIMGHYFPGLFEELRQAGATPVDLGYDTGWYQAGCWRARTQTGMVASLQSRPFLEGAVRRRVRALPGVRFLTECDATGLQTDSARTRVTGVHIHQRADPAHDATLPADLVVDAGGRGSRLPLWLEGLGYGRVEEVNVRMDVAYTTRFYHIPAHFAADWKMLIIIPQPPHETRMGLIIPMEGRQWMVSLVGWLGDHAPTDDAGFLEFARSLPVPDLYHAIKDAEPATPIALHKIPTNQWRHYERMARFPEGLVALGDALSSFNPTYGQGMTTAALYVQTLDRCLGAQARRAAPTLDGLADRFRKQVAKVVATPWMLATVEDFRYPQTTGQRPPPTPLLHWYLGKLYRATEHDPRLVAQFLQVMHMFRSPAALFLPHIAWRVLTAGRRAPAPAQPAAPVTPEAPGTAVSA